ncbi:MAG: pilus assembly protein PilM [Gammaproteobacteria bacterium]|jgi:Tfp pilus assembly PilM family ATPase
MLRHLFYRPHTSIGIDVNDTGVAVVVLRKERKKISILHASVSVVDGDQQKIKFLSDFFIDNKVRKKNIYIAIPAWQVIKKELSFDAALRDFDIKIQLELEQGSYFPGINEKLVFDIVREQTVTVYAAKQQGLNRKLEFLNAAKIIPVCVEPDNFAWLRLIKFNQKPSLVIDEVGVLLVVQQQILKIIFFNQNEILYENSETIIKQNAGFVFVRDNLEHFASANLDDKLATIYVIGPQDWIKQLRQCINLPVVEVVPFENIDEKLWLACGLALRGIDDQD